LGGSLPLCECTGRRGDDCGATERNGVHTDGKKLVSGGDRPWLPPATAMADGVRVLEGATSG
jgi:hypothetical protein